MYNISQAKKASAFEKKTFQHFLLRSCHAQLGIAFITAVSTTPYVVVVVWLMYIFIVYFLLSNALMTGRK